LVGDVLKQIIILCKNERKAAVLSLGNNAKKPTLHHEKPVYSFNHLFAGGYITD